MVTGRTSVFSCAANFLRGRKCIFCGSFKLSHTSRGYVRCSRCGKSKSLSRLRREIHILQGFYQLQPAYRLSQDLGVDIKVVTRVYQRMREALYHLTELEAGKLKGEIELDEAYFGGKRKGKRGRAAAGKSVVFGLLERDGRVYTKVVESVSAEELMQHIQAKTRKGSVYFTDAFRGYQSLKRYGKHHTVNHSKSLVDRRTKNHINGIEGFWGYAKTRLSRFRGINKRTFYLHLKECEFRFNHRGQNLYQLLLKILRKAPLN